MRHLGHEWEKLERELQDAGITGMALTVLRKAYFGGAANALMRAIRDPDSIREMVFEIEEEARKA